MLEVAGGMGSAMRTKQVDPTTLTLAGYNPRKISDDEMAKLEASIERWGFVQPVIARADGEVVAGHQRLAAAIRMGVKKVPVLTVEDLDDNEARLLNIALNKISGEWDDEKLGALFLELGEVPALDLSVTGFSLGEIGRLTAAVRDPEGRADALPDAASVTSRAEKGDIWLLGAHRLMCGDATSEADVRRLLGGVKPQLCLTDPPYGIDIVKVDGSGKLGGGGPYSGKSGKGRSIGAKTYRPIVGDDKPFDPRFLLETAVEQVIFGANFFASKLPDGKAWVVWDKDASGTFSPCELAWTSRTGRLYKYDHMWSGLRREGPRDEELKERVHPTQKPVGLFSAILEDFSEDGDSVIDAFLGSGTTVIACEKLGRTCYAMEIEPAYVDVALQRWEEFTGEKATKDG